MAKQSESDSGKPTAVPGILPVTSDVEAEDPALASTPIPVSIGRRAVRGAIVLSAATYVNLLLGIGARKILAVLLLPVEFGMINAALSFVDLVVSFGSFSFSSAIINVRDNLIQAPLEKLRENIFLLTFATNFFVAALAIILGALFPPQAGGTIVIALISLYAAQRFTSALDTYYAQLLERELIYEKISRVSLAANVLLHVASVVIALAGETIWSIPVATILSTLVSLTLHQYYAKHLGLELGATLSLRDYRPATVRWLFGFGGKVLLNRLFEAWLFRVDNLLVFHLLNFVALGYYSQAFLIASMPSMALAPIVARVSIATYAELQATPERLRAGFHLTNFFLVRLLVPSTVIVLLASDQIVQVFLSSKFSRASAVLQSLFGLVLTLALFENAKMVLGSTLRLKEISFVRAAQLVVLVGGIWLFGSSGLVEVGLTVSAVSILGYVYILQFVSQTIRIDVKRLFQLPAMLGLAALGVVGLILGPSINRIELPQGLFLTAFTQLCLISLSVFLLTIGGEWLISPTEYREKIAFVRSRAKK